MMSQGMSLIRTLCCQAEVAGATHDVRKERIKQGGGISNLPTVCVSATRLPRSFLTTAIVLGDISSVIIHVCHATAAKYMSKTVEDAELVDGCNDL